MPANQGFLSIPLYGLQFPGLDQNLSNLMTRTLHQSGIDASCGEENASWIPSEQSAVTARCCTSVGKAICRPDFAERVR